MHANVLKKVNLSAIFLLNQQVWLVYFLAWR